MAIKKKSIKMNLYSYSGTDKKGNKVFGEVKAATLSLAKASLRSQEINVHKIEKKSTSFLVTFFKKKVSEDEITQFTRQMSTMISAGIPMVQSFSVIIEGSASGPFADLIRNIKQDVETGTAFSNALTKYPEAFDSLYCSLVAAGEQSGTLDVMFARIATYKEKTLSLKRKIKKAMFYPITVICIAVLVTVLLLVKVVPTFKKMFEGFNAELPTFTVLVLNLSDLIQHYFLYVGAAIIVIIYILRQLYVRSAGIHYWVQVMLLKVPIFGELIKRAAVARFARTLSTTVAAGVPIGDALDSVAKATGNDVYQQAVVQIKDSLITGEQLRPAIHKTGLFPPMVEQMVGIGEESGALEDMLGKVATIYEEQVDLAIESLATLIEPIILVILGVLIGGLVVAMYLPIFKLGSIV